MKEKKNTTTGRPSQLGEELRGAKEDENLDFKGGVGESNDLSGCRFRTWFVLPGLRGETRSPSYYRTGEIALGGGGGPNMIERNSGRK